MKRLVTFATAAALVVGASAAGAQERIAPRFDLGVYGGWSWTSAWFEDGDDSFGIGSQPAFGAQTTFWATPSFGVRFNGTYIPSDFPHNEDRPLGVEDADYPLNNYFLDLEGVFRPMWAGDYSLMSSLYLWLGGGVMFTDVAGDPPVPAGFEYVCVANYAPLGTCLSYEPGYATVGQGTAGIGFDLVSLASNLGIFGELGAHVYDSPTHSVLDEEDKMSVTGRGVLGLKLSLGSLAPPIVPVPPTPAPTPAPPPPAPPAERQIQVCVVQPDGDLELVTASFRPATQDTMISGRAFAQAHPATAPRYAAGANWFIQQDTMSFGDRSWVKFGVTRVIQPPQLQRVGDINGTAIFAESGRAEPYEVVYVPVRPGCEFQPYQPRAAIRPRG